MFIRNTFSIWVTRITVTWIGVGITCFARINCKEIIQKYFTKKYSLGRQEFLLHGSIYSSHYNWCQNLCRFFYHFKNFEENCLKTGFWQKMFLVCRIRIIYRNTWFHIWPWSWQSFCYFISSIITQVKYCQPLVRQVVSTNYFIENTINK